MRKLTIRNLYLCLCLGRSLGCVVLLLLYWCTRYHRCKYVGLDDMLNSCSCWRRTSCRRLSLEGLHGQSNFLILATLMRTKAGENAAIGSKKSNTNLIGAIDSSIPVGTIITSKSTSTSTP